MDVNMYRNKTKPICLIVHHVLWSRTELLVALYDLVHRVEEILLRHGLPAGTDGVHASFCADTPYIGP